MVKNVGENAQFADVERQKMEQRLRAAQAAKAAGITLPVDALGGKTLEQLRDEFLVEKKLEPHRSDDAYRTHEIAIDEFLAYSKRVYPGNISGTDILSYASWLTSEGEYSERTRANRMMRLFSFLKFAKVDTAKLLTKAQRHYLLNWTKKLPTIYTPEEIKAMLTHAGRAYNRVLILLALSTGLRDMEIQFLEWSDIDWGTRCLSVHKKEALGFCPKDGEERSIALSDELLNTLKTWRSLDSTTRFVFQTSGAKPDTKLLGIIKRVARRAGLNCGECVGCRGKHNECRRFTLHKFRRTFITRILRKSDLRTAMYLAGHSDIKSTMRYLRPEQGASMQASVNAALADVAGMGTAAAV